MNILRVIASMDPATGGPCQGIRNTIPELTEFGIYNEVVCVNEPTAAFLQKDAFTIHPLGKGKGPWAYQPKLLPWLLFHLERFDVVIIHGLWLYPGYAVYKAIHQYKKEKRKKIPRVFVMPHGMLDPYFQKARERKLKAMRNWLYWKLIEASIINRADGVLFTCEEEMELARQSFQPYHPKKELNIGYGIQSPPVFDINHKIAFGEKLNALNKPYFLFLSRIHDKKGVDLLVTAYLTQKRKNNSFPALVIAGPGMDEAYGRQIKKMASGDDDIFFPGMLTGDAKWGAFYGCKAFILPSHQENFGIAIAEAMACGKPVLISNKVNIWKEIRSAGAGIVATDTFDGVMQLFETWNKMTYPEKEKMGITARQTFHDQFTVEKAALKFLQAITDESLQPQLIPEHV